MDQKEIQNENITNKINSMKNIFERRTTVNPDHMQDKIPSNLFNNSVNEKINIFEKNLQDFESKRQKNKFSDITKKFGITSLKDSTKDPHLDEDKIRKSVIINNVEDFQTRIKRFDTKKDANSNVNLTGFLQEAHSIIDNYEKEIEFLRKQIFDEKEHRKNSIQVDLNVSNFDIEANARANFMNRMKYFSEKDPTLEEIMNIFNDKISELFNENEKLENLLKQKKQSESEFQKLEVEVKKLNDMLKDKNTEISTINDIYQQKFQEVFIENSHLMNEIEDSKTDNANLKEVYNNENKMLREIVVKNENTIKEKDDRISILERELEECNKSHEEKVQSLENAINQEKNHLNEKMLEFAQKEENQKLEMENAQNFFTDSLKDLQVKFSESESKLNELQNKLEERENELKEKELSSENLIKDKDSEIEKLRLTKEQFEISNKELADKIEIEEKLKEKENELIEMTQTLEHLESKTKDQNDELENLREIITRDQIRIKELKEFKALSEENNEANNLITEENILLKNEITLFKQKCEEEIKKGEEVDKRKRQMENEKDDLQKEIVKREKIIEKILKIEEDLKQQMKEKEETILNLNQQLESKEEIVNKKNILESNLMSLKTCASIPNEFAKEMMIDYIFYLYIYDNSISLQNVLETLLNNFGLYMNTIFLKRDEYRPSFSLIHEFLEDIFFRVYDTFIKTKLAEIKSNQNSQISISQVSNIKGPIIKQKNAKDDSKENIWSINQEDIDLDLIKQVSKDIMNKNVLTHLNSMNRKEKTIEDIIEIFIQKYGRVFNFEGLEINAYIEKEIKPFVLEKIDKYQKNLLNEIRTILEFSVVNFHSGKIINNNNKILYDFKEFFCEYLTKDSRQQDTLVASQNIEVPEAVDNLIFSMKKGNLKSIFLMGSFTNIRSDFSLGKITLSMIIYCPNLINLSITDSNLDDGQMGYLVKLVDFLKSLKHLDLSGNNIKETGVKLLADSLKSNKNILSLYLNKNNILSNGGFYLADTLIKNQTLEKLSLASNMINENGLSSLLTVLSNNNSSIKYLDISDNFLTADDFKNISELIQSSHSLQTLNISYNSIDAVSAHFLGLSLKNVNKLSVLYLQNTNLTEENCALLFKNLTGSKLSEIHLDSNLFGEIGAILLSNILKNNHDLKFLSLKKCSISSMGLNCLSKVLEVNNTLEGINLEENSFDDQSIALLHKCISSQGEEVRKIKIYLSLSYLSSKSKELLKNSKQFILY